jgi:hypothetical protein
MALPERYLGYYWPGDLVVRGTFPFVIIAVGLWVLAWAERSRALAAIAAVYTATALLSSLYNMAGHRTPGDPQPQTTQNTQPAGPARGPQPCPQQRPRGGPPCSSRGHGRGQLAYCRRPLEEQIQEHAAQRVRHRPELPW